MYITFLRKQYNPPSDSQRKLFDASSCQTDGPNLSFVMLQTTRQGHVKGTVCFLINRQFGSGFLSLYGLSETCSSPAQFLCKFRTRACEYLLIWKLVRSKGTYCTQWWQVIITSLLIKFVMSSLESFRPLEKSGVIVRSRDHFQKYRVFYLI